VVLPGIADCDKTDCPVLSKTIHNQWNLLFHHKLLQNLHRSCRILCWVTMKSVQSNVYLSFYFIYVTITLYCSAEKAVNERLAHTPELYLLALAQFAITADTPVVSFSNISPFLFFLVSRWYGRCDPSRSFFFVVYSSDQHLRPTIIQIQPHRRGLLPPTFQPLIV